MNLKKWIMIGLSALLLIGSIGFTSCGKRNQTLVFEKDGLVYEYDTLPDIYYIRDDKEENNPKVWHINPYYEGHEVAYFGVYYGGAWQGGSFFAPSLLNVEELSLPYCMKPKEALSSDAVKHVPTKVIIVENTQDLGYFIGARYGDYYKDSYMRKIYCTAISYDDRVQRSLTHKWGGWPEETKEYLNGEYHFHENRPSELPRHFKICKANTSYMFNYVDAPNDGYFFIQDYEYGEKIEETPYIPLREGYVFGGWYKEAACINKWNFEKDTLPQTLYNENGEEIYQEIKLYAKWIKEEK